MQTMAKEWIEEGKQIGLQEGLQQGHQQGHQQGRQESQRATILRILHRRFQPQEEILQSLTQQLEQITDDGTLLQLVDLALDVMVLPDFRVSLQRLSAASSD